MPEYYVKKKTLNFKKYIKLVGVVFIGIGAFFIFYFFFPLISYQIFIASAFSKNNIEVPIPKSLVVNNNTNTLSSLIAQGISSLTTDFTDARNWYPTLSPQVDEKNTIESYSLTIPKINIENAVVSTIDYNLAEHLVQYFGTSIPGENGTAVIFGHSTLPQLFDPKNYKTIFANAHNLKVGDELFATVSGITYKYKIFSIVVTSPEDTNMFSQSYDHSYLTIVTCTPPGTIWKRLVVRAALDSITN
jgi:sortase A